MIKNIIFPSNDINKQKIGINKHILKTFKHILHIEKNP